MNPSRRPTGGPSALRSSLVLALGFNLWLTALVVPAIGLRAADLAALSLPAPLLLAFGAMTRNAAALLVGMPLATLLPLGLSELSAARQSAGPFVMVSLALVLYLLAALRMLAAAQVPACDALVSRRSLPPEAPPRYWQEQRWLRRIAMASAALVPAFFLYFIDLDPGLRRAVAAQETHPESALALWTAGGTLASVVFIGHGLLRPLAGHLEQDRAVWREVTAARRTRWVFFWMLGLGLIVIAAALMLRLGKGQGQ
ncbi:MAG TPA: hypothetical protein VH877_04930 [Polyangia bacterium]|jgi:hypothetical protein|nr:hypothetical protein [Polyangia bacterium]